MVVMSIRWDELQMMPGPRWRARDPFDREKLARAKQRQRGGHKTGKNHSTRDEVLARRAKLERHRKVLAVRDAVAAAYHAAVRAYWQGDRETHP